MDPLENKYSMTPLSSQQESNSPSSGSSASENKVQAVAEETFLGHTQEERGGEDRQINAQVSDPPSKGKKRKSREGNQERGAKRVATESSISHQEESPQERVESKLTSIGDKNEQLQKSSSSSSSSSSSTTSSSSSSNMITCKNIFNIPSVEIPKSLYIPDNDSGFAMYNSPIWVDIENLSSEAEKAVNKEMCNAPGVSFLSRVKELYPNLKKFYICSDHSMQQCHAYSVRSNKIDVSPPNQEENESFVFYYLKDRRDVFEIDNFVNENQIELGFINLGGLLNLMLSKGLLERNDDLYYAIDSDDLIKKIYDVLIEGNVNIPELDHEKELLENDFLYNIYNYMEGATNGYPPLAHTAIKIKDNIVAGKILGGPVIIHRAEDLLGESYEKIRGLKFRVN